MFENNFARADPLCGKISAARPRNARGAATRKAIMTNYFDDIVKNLAHAVTYDSSQSPAKEGMPFGEGAAKCLEFYLSLADFMGFDTKNYDNYAGEVRWGEGKDFAVLAHLDVVPAGSGWTHDPFGGEIADGKIYGRGATDDKGPAVICLYCLKALKDAGFAPARTIKLIAGCNEETGWKCIEHYNACAEMPKEGFSPDADFPVIYAEKGILHIRLDYPLADAPFTALRGGERENMVCDYARAEGAAFDPARGEKYGVAAEGSGIAAHGRAAHASTPEAGENALEKLLRYFAEESEGVARVAADLFDDRLGLRQLRDETGSLTLSPDVASYREGVLSVLADIRYPASMRREEILGRLEKLGVPCTVLHAQAPLLSEKEGALVSTLRRVYEQETGQAAEPIAIGGGTYARALERGAAFGPEFPGEPSTIHQKDEYISLDNVRRLLRIYCAAIRALTEGEKKG